jgi:hypothetical protein
MTDASHGDDHTEGKASPTPKPPWYGPAFALATIFSALAGTTVSVVGCIQNHPHTLEVGVVILSTSLMALRRQP